MLALPVLLGKGVNVAAKSLGFAVAVKPLIVPPVVVMSETVNPTGFSEKEKAMAAVSPALRDVLSEVMARVGARVSKLSGGELPAPPGLPRASV